MKLYHATSKENIENILVQGLTAVHSIKESEDVRLEGKYVFGFDNIDDARNYIVYDNNCPDYAIVSFTSDDAIIDPEYDGESFAVAYDIENAILEEEGLYND